MQAQISVIIPNYNGIEYISRCLEAIREQSRKPDLVIVVDNGSHDGSAELIRERFPEVMLRAFPENTGFCGAVNEGIRISREKGMDFCILLNNDTKAETHFIRELEKAILADSRIFSCQARMLRMSDPSKIDDAGDFYCALGWAFARGKGRNKEAYARAGDLFFACAGAAIYRMEVFGRIGVFDERHFAYLEDADIGWRARIEGYRNVYAPRAEVLHVGSASSGSLYNHFKVTNASRNSIYLISKNMPLWQILLNLPFLVPGFLIKAAFFASRGFGKIYVNGILAGFRLSREGKKAGMKVLQRPENARNYAKIQLELWLNMVRRLMG